MRHTLWTTVAFAVSACQLVAGITERSSGGACTQNSDCPNAEVCLLKACAPADDSAGAGAGGKANGATGGTTTVPEGGTNTGGGAGGAGGSGTEIGDAGMAGTSGGTLGASGGTLGATGGALTNTGGNTGGAITSTGGSSSGGKGGNTSAQGGKGGSGGSSTGGSSGGSGTGGSKSSCVTYDGGLATSGASKIFNSGYGTSTAGVWMGYAFTYTYGTGAVIKPVSSVTESCFDGATLCAAGSVPANDTAGAGLGWNLNQAADKGTTGSVSLTGAVKLRLAGAKANMRISLGPVTGGEYCYNLTAADATNANLASGLTLAAGSFKQSCFDPLNAIAYAGQMIKSIQVLVPGNTAGAAQTFDFCLVDIEPS